MEEYTVSDFISDITRIIKTDKELKDTQKLNKISDLTFLYKHKCLYKREYRIDLKDERAVWDLVSDIMLIIETHKISEVIQKLNQISEAISKFEQE